MTDQDKEYLLWLAKRLVYKYGEKPDVINKIIGIIKRVRTEQKLYQENANNTVLCVSNAINSLSSIQKIYTNSNIGKNIQNIKTTTDPMLFDSIDMDNFIKGV